MFRLPILLAALLALAHARGAVMVGADNPKLPDPKATQAGSHSRLLTPDAPELVLPNDKPPEDNRLRMRVLEADAKLAQARKLYDSQNFPEAINELRRLDKEMPFNAAIKMALADCMMKIGEITNSIQEAKAAVEISPDEPSFRLLLSTAYSMNGEFGAALDEVEKCLVRNPSNAQARLNKGVLLNKLGKSDEAIAYFKKELEVDPAYVSGHNMLGVLYYGRRDYTNAIHHFDQMIKLAPDQANGAINSGLCLLAMDKPKDALERFRAIVKADPLNPEGYGFAGLCLERLREMEKAMQMYRQAIYVDPMYQDGYTMLAGLLLARNHLEEAEKVLRSGIEKSPKATTLYRLLADLLKRQERHGEAAEIMLTALDHGFLEAENWRTFLTSFQRVLEKVHGGSVPIAPGRLTNNVDRSIWHFRMYQESIARTNITASALHLTQATLLDGTRPEFFNDLGSLSSQHLGPRACIPFFLAALYLKPDYEPARRNLIANAGQADEKVREQRLKEMQEHLKIQPSQPDVWFSAGLLLAQLNRASEAIEYFQKAVELDPKNFNFRMDYAKALFMSGKLDESQQQCLTALIDSPANYLIQYQVAWIIAQKDLPSALDLDLAETEMRKATDVVGPRDPRYPWLMGKIYAKRGKWEQAITEIQRAIDISRKTAKTEWVKLLETDLVALQNKEIPAPDIKRGLTHALFAPPVPAPAAPE
jgi:tetratricopeptide (TPR) repeat protein